MKLTRSFLGAGLGAFCAVWPAATWDNPWCLVIGALFGWVLGYHGDRVIHSLIRGRQQVQRVGFQATLTALVKQNILTVQVSRSVQNVEDSFNWLLRLMRRFDLWLQEHQVNQAVALRFLSGLAGASLLVSVIWYLTGNHIFVNGVTTVRYMLVAMTVMTFGVLPALVAIILFYKEQFSMKGFYRIWEHYASRGPVLFFLGEALRFLWIEVWVLWTAFLFTLGLVFGWLPSMFISVLVWGGVVNGLKLAWRVVRLNRDYGLISLGIALLFGTLTFHVYHEDLVVDASFRLGASVMAGFVAGTVSFLVTWLCGVMFRHSIMARRIALRSSGYFTTRNLCVFYDDTLLDWWWKQNRRLLPTLS